MAFKVYDKVSWHYPDGNAPNIKSATNHFVVIMGWLNKNNLLTKIGKMSSVGGLGEDFSLTSEMLTPEGNALLGKYYNNWLKTINYKTPPTTSFWNNVYKIPKQNKKTKLNERVSNKMKKSKDDYLYFLSEILTENTDDEIYNFMNDLLEGIELRGKVLKEAACKNKDGKPSMAKMKASGPASGVVTDSSGISKLNKSPKPIKK